MRNSDSRQRVYERPELPRPGGLFRAQNEKFRQQTASLPSIPNRAVRPRNERSVIPRPGGLFRGQNEKFGKQTERQSSVTKTYFVYLIVCMCFYFVLYLVFELYGSWLCKVGQGLSQFGIELRCAVTAGIGKILVKFCLESWRPKVAPTQDFDSGYKTSAKQC